MYDDFGCVLLFSMLFFFYTKCTQCMSNLQNKYSTTKPSQFTFTHYQRFFKLWVATQTWIARALSLGRGPFCDPKQLQKLKEKTTTLPLQTNHSETILNKNVFEFNTSLKPSSKFMKHFTVNVNSTFKKK